MLKLVDNAGVSVDRARFDRARASETGFEKENRAGWPGLSWRRLDAVTSQRGATGAEAAFWLG